MPLTQDQEDREHELRVDQMALNIKKMEKDMQWESRKFAVQLVLMLAAAAGAGAAVMNYISHREPPPIQVQQPR